MKSKFLSFFFFSILIYFVPGHTSFASVNATTLDEVKASLKTAGNHRFVYMMFFKLYDAQLYTDATSIQGPDQLLDGSSALLLEFDYLRKIKKSIILESSEKLLIKNMSPAELASIQERVDRLNRVYRTVDKGDCLALSYVPGEGTTLWINDKPAITIEGNDFVQLYFRIWLGEQPISRQMRDDLLQPVLIKG